MQIRLRFKVQRYTQEQSKAAVDVYCTAVSDQMDTDCNVFVVQKLPENYTGQSDERFSHVADPVDMEDYSTSKSDDAPYFRTNSVQLRVRTQDHANSVIDGLKQGVSRLVKAFNQLPSSQAVQFQSTFDHTSDSNGLSYIIIGDIS